MNVFYLGNYRIYVREDGDISQIIENLPGIYFNEFLESEE